MAAPVLVTPEAVLLDLATAGVPTRALARLLDLVAQVLLLFAFFFVLGVAGGDALPGTAIVVLSLFFVPLILFGYPIGFETAMRGRTPGKAAFGLRVVTKEGAPIRFRHAVVRGALDIVDVLGLGLLPGIPGLVSIFASHDAQRLGDMAAGTLVVRERSATRAPTATTFAVPPGLESYAASVDVSRLAEADHQAARSFLLRAPSMAPHARAHVAAQLAATLAARIGHQPPSWLAPEQLLAVLVARRQQRSAGPPQPSVGWAPTGPLVPPVTAPRASSIWPGAAAPPPRPDRPTAPPAAPDTGFSAPT